ncbi:kinesin-like protein KIN-14G [Vigna radiata var. radiata]|uniref:Kinesin-like protein KIN-14G n=1 Tax=Vigna radiata var. radiata TaxID=3916 RepID=A0A3Q0FA29_VIGRR|nr:kinesin-like protein KIN-14G [Vigna radiata var. radiata]
MAPELALPFSVVSVVEDVLQTHGSCLSDIHLASRMAEEASSRRNEAAGWLRKTVGVVGGKDIPDEPTEEDFRIALRSGIVLCNALNKIQPGAVPKVVEVPCDSVVIPDGAPLSTYQYFENVRNFLVTMEEMGLPTFEVSDIEQGGKSSRIVNCVLALKSYSEWKQGGKNGSWKYGGNPKPPTNAKPAIMMKVSEPFMRSLSKGSRLGDKDGLLNDISTNSEGGSIPSLNLLIREILSDKKLEEIPTVVESLLSRVMEEFEKRLLIQQEMFKTTQNHKAVPEAEDSNVKSACNGEEMEQDKDVVVKHKEFVDVKYNVDEEPNSQYFKQQELFQQQNENVQELKMMVHQTKTGMQVLQNKYQEDMIYLSKHLHGLASAASGYQKIFEENRKLYNQLQDLKGNIRVYCRVRPSKGAQPNHHCSVSNIDEGSISLIVPSKNGKDGKKTFNFNRVFGPSSTQAEVFSDTKPLIRSVLDGYNVCIFAYGQTGSGKTHTMSGPDNYTEETVGVNFRALKDLFQISEQRKDTIHYDISVQMLEIYNEQVRDLLSTDSTHKRYPFLEIRNSSHNGINVPDANLVPVSSTSDVLKLMNLGQNNRAVSSTAMNDRSSRSHSCLTVHVHGRELASGNSLRGCIHLVDLAGSERVDKSEVTGDRLKEAQHINKSLSALGDVIASLAQKQSHVPYRNSKLTQLLQDSLGGQAKTLMFVHVSPEPDAIGETISTLKFAERVSTVELGAARVNKDSSEVKELKEQIAILKATSARKDGESEQFHQSANSISETPKSKSLLSSTARSPTSSHGNRKPPREDSSNTVEDKKKGSPKLTKRGSLDPLDVRRNSPPWPHHAEENGNEDDKELVSGDCLGKHTKRNGQNNLVGDCDTESKRSSSPTLSPLDIFDPSKICTEVTTINDCDEFELATSESSESDKSWESSHVHVPKATTLSNGVAAKTKKSPHSRQAKNQENRSKIPSLSPSSSRRQPTVVSQQKKHLDAKRRTGNAK